MAMTIWYLSSILRALASCCAALFFKAFSCSASFFSSASLWAYNSCSSASCCLVAAMLSFPASLRDSLSSFILSPLSLTLSIASSWSFVTSSSLCCVSSMAKSMNIWNESMAGAKTISSRLPKRDARFSVREYPVPSAFLSPFPCHSVFFCLVSGLLSAL